MNPPSPQEMAKAVGNELGQTHLVVQCLVLAIIKQPGFDASSFLSALEIEAQRMMAPCDTAKEVISSILAEAKNHLP